MSKKYKTYEKVKRQPKQRTYSELLSLLKMYGFIIDESSGKGSHSPVRHPDFPDLRWTLSRKKPMSIFHAKKVVALVEEVMRREES